MEKSKQYLLLHNSVHKPSKSLSTLRNRLGGNVPHLLLCFFPTLFFLCACGKKSGSPADTLFSKLEPAETGIAFSNTLPEETPDGMNIIQYLYYYNGGGVAAGDVNDDGWADLYFTSNLGSNKLYLNKGNFIFEDATERAGVAGVGDWKTGTTMADVNGDGRLDIYVSQVGRYKQFSGKNQLFINQGDGTFKEEAAAYGLDFSAFGTQAAFFDYDLDQDLDCFLLCHSVHSAGSYRDTTFTRKYDPLAADRLLENPGAGAQNPAPFRDISAQKGIYGGPAGYGLGLAVGDLNADGYPDVYVANDFHENDYLYYNVAGKTFYENIAGSMGHSSNFSMGCDLADFNNDTRPDLVSLDMKPEEETILKASQPADPYDVYLYKHQLGYHWQFPRNALQLNQGGGWKVEGRGRTLHPLPCTFSEIGQLAGIAATDWSWSALLADLDLDGWKDLYITNGIVRRPNDLDYLRFISTDGAQRSATDRQLIEKMPSGAATNYCFRNRGDLQFENASESWGLAQRGCSNGAVYVDLDNDGDLDLVTNNLNAPASVYRNNTRNAQYLKIKFRGEGLNTFGIGANVTLWAGGHVQYYENQPVRGFQSSVEPNLTIGLGSNARVDSLLVCWPGGKKQRLRGMASQQVLTLRASDAAFVEKTDQNMQPKRPAATVDRHEGNDFQDNTREKLVPWFVSTQGPKLAVGDLNGDGLDDVYAPGSSRIQLQQKSGVFAAAALSNVPPAAAQSCATFFDADGDRKPDLYLGTGYDASGGDSSLLDVLFLNPGGSGRFVRPLENALPFLRENTSCARAADVDGDGDQDLFVGARSIGGAYGLIPNSYLLFNDGKGHFSQASAVWWPDTKIGMVNDALWADFNGDGRPDLAVAGAWMPMIIFMNTGSGFEKIEIGRSTGLWTSLASVDVDGDGDGDLAAGNLGLNSNLRATSAEPLGLWVRDFDGNGATDPVMSYFRQGKNCVLADKDWLLSQLPGLKKDYVDYLKYAESSFEQVFPKKMRENAAYYRVEMLETAVFINGGRDAWTVNPLPIEAQFSPVFALLPGDFNGDGRVDLLAGGNLYEVQPAIGRMDASYGTLLAGDGKGGFKALLPAESGFWLNGAVRDLQFVRGAGGKKRILTGRNGGAVSILGDGMLK